MLRILLVTSLLELVMIDPGLRAAPAEVLADGEVQAILDKTLRLDLAVDTGALSAPEREAMRLLIDAGNRLHRLYLRSLHRQAETAEQLLGAAAATGDAAAGQRLELFQLFRGPIATTLDNRLVPLTAVDVRPPGVNLYPWGVKREEIEAQLAAHPEDRAELLHPRTVVRRVDVASLSGDLRTFDRHPALLTLLPGLEPRLRALLIDPAGRQFYAVPYALAYADELFEVHQRLTEAAAVLTGTDDDLAAYLRHRALDLLRNDYEAGDAAWVTGAFQHLNAQLGAYETYDDALFGVKAFFGGSVLVRDAQKSAELSRSIGELQAIEDALPYAPHKRVRSDIPVGVYNVLADFGQARGTNTASILPNDAAHARKYGRTILLRYNILTEPRLFQSSLATFQAATVAEHHADLDIDGNFHRTLWHEVGHYLGPAVDRQGRDLGDALQENSDLMEELKADLVALFAARHLADRELLSAAALRSIQASGVLRVLQKVKPRREQPYQTMQLMQMNWFLENGLLAFDGAAQRLRIDYARFDAVAAGMLREVLALQYQGNKDAVERFVAHFAVWHDDIQEVIAKATRERETNRFRLVRYAALLDG